MLPYLFGVQQTESPGIDVELTREFTRELNEVDLCSRSDKFKQLHRPCEEELLGGAGSQPQYN